MYHVSHSAKEKPVLFIVRAAVIAALYVALTYAGAPLAYGGVQFRISEALTILPVFTPAAIPGLTIGCILGNLGSPLGLTDIICGTLATLLAAILVRLTAQVTVKGFPVMAPVFPIVCNAVIVGAELAILTLPEGFSVWGFLTMAGGVALGEVVVCVVLGGLLWAAIHKSGRAAFLFGPQRPARADQ